MNNPLKLLLSVVGMLAIVACSDSGSSGGRAESTEVDGTYYITPEDNADGSFNPEGLMILGKGSARTITVHNGETTENQYTYSVSNNKLHIAAKTAFKRYNCNGKRISSREISTNSVANYKMLDGDLEIEINGSKKVMKRATQSDTDRILGLPKCQVE